MIKLLKKLARQIGSNSLYSIDSRYTPIARNAQLLKVVIEKKAEKKKSVQNMQTKTLIDFSRRSK